MGFAPDGLTPEIMELPQFKAGAARGAMKMRADEMQMERTDARERAMLDRQLQVQKAENESRERMAADERSGDLLRTLLTPRSAASIPRKPIRVTEGGGDTGKPRVQYDFTPEELEAYQNRQKEAADAAALDKADAPILEALRKYDELKSLGKGADIETDASGNPVITESSFWDTATPEVIEALRRRSRGRGKTNAPVPLGVLVP
jgi:hypothetical protein